MIFKPKYYEGKEVCHSKNPPIRLEFRCITPVRLRFHCKRGGLIIRGELP